MSELSVEMEIDCGCVELDMSRNVLFCVIFCVFPDNDAVRRVIRVLVGL